MKLPLPEKDYQKLLRRLKKEMKKKIFSIEDVIEGRISIEPGYGSKTMYFKLSKSVGNLTDQEIEALCESNSYNFGFKIKRTERDCIVTISTD